MNGYRLRLILCLLIGLLGAASAVVAQDDSRLEARLYLEPLEPQAVGTRPTITARLVGEDGRANPNKVLKLYLDGEPVRQVRTDDLGLADIRISRDLPIGEYQVKVMFEGTEAYQPASASMTLVVRPIQLTIETVPAVADVRFMLDDQPFVSGADGLAVVEIGEPGTYQVQVMDVDDIQVNPETRVTFSRWADAGFEPVRTVEVRRDTRLQVGFNTSHPIGLSFVDFFRNPVDESRVPSVTFKRSDGRYFTYESTDPQWLTASRVMRRKEGLEASPLLYSVESVMVDGTNAINRYQQRFYVEHSDTWTIELLLYSARIQAADAVFGFSLGDGILLQYPDGHTETFKFDDNGSVFIPSLARGLYHVQVQGAAGMAPLTPIALSKDQDVTLKVLSVFDIAAAIALGTIGALALLLYKRPHILGLVFGWVPRPRKARPQPVPAPALAAASPVPDPMVAVTPVPVDQVVNVAGLTPNGEMWLLERYHPNGFACPHCGHVKARIAREDRRSGLTVYHCCSCQKQYTLYTGTPLEGSHLTLAQSRRLALDGSLNPSQLAKELGLTPKTVRKWQQRLQAAAGSPGAQSDSVEALPSSVEHT